MDEAALPPVPELMLVLHTGGPVETCRSGDGCEARSLPGQVSVFAPGVDWSFRSGGTLQGVSLHFSLARLGRLAEESDPGSVRSLESRIGFTDPFLASGAQALLHEVRRPSERGTLYGDTLGDALGLHVLRVARRVDDERPCGRSLSAKQLRTAIDLLEQSIESGISLEALAHRVGVSRYQLRRGFVRATGAPPHRYLTDRRIERAKALLLRGEASLVEIALACGFSSQAHFCGRFRARTGVSPGRYRADRC